jgi:hypothetical protein
MLTPTDHLALDQLRLMEDAYYVLRLDRHANAPDNRGWMNLFRRWGQARRLNEVLRDYEDLFTLEFFEFYVQYIACYVETIDDHPVPHPWDPLGSAVRAEAADANDCHTRTRHPSDLGTYFPGWAGKAVRGIYLDPGLREADVRSRPIPLVTPGAQGTPPPPSPTPRSAPTTPPTPPASDSSADTE